VEVMHLYTSSTCFCSELLLSSSIICILSTQYTVGEGNIRWQDTNRNKFIIQWQCILPSLVHHLLPDSHHNLLQCLLQSHKYF
jgi:hypothetical protein